MIMETTPTLKSSAFVHQMHVTLAEEKLLLRLRQLGAGQYLVTVETDANGINGVTIWNDEPKQREHLKEYRK